MNTSASSMNRPVTARDIAAALHLSLNTVTVYLSKKERNSATAQRVRDYAEKVGYDPKKALEYGRRYKNTEKPVIESYYYNGNFHTKEEEVARMKELREQGFSNAEIAKKLGRGIVTVWNAIGKQDKELTLQNIAMAAHIRAQKNAARKQYVVNKPIREYNAKVEQHNKMKAELNKLQTELLTEKSAIVQAAKTKIDFPLVDLHTVQPTALQ